MNRMLFYLLLLLSAGSLFAQTHDAIRRTTLPDKQELPGTFKVFYQKDGTETFRWLRRGGVELKPEEELAFEAELGESPSADQLPALVKVQHLARISLKASGYTAESMKLIAGVPELTCLTLYGDGLTDATVASFTEVKQLRHLKLGLEHLTAVGLKYFAGNADLRELDLGGKSLTDEHLTVFHECKALQTLDVSGAGQISGAGFGDWALRELDASLCQNLTDEALSVVFRHRKLEKLDLRFCKKLTGACLKELNGCESLQTVGLSNCGALQDSGVRHLCTCPNVWFLDISSCDRLTRFCVSSAAALPKLQRLLASGLKATDDQVKTWKDHQSIQILDFGYCKLTDASLEALASLPELRELYIYGSTAVTDTGLEKLASCKKLVYLVIDDCTGVTGEGVASLQKSLPRLRVSRTINSDLAETPDGN